MVDAEYLAGVCQMMSVLTQYALEVFGREAEHEIQEHPLRCLRDGHEAIASRCKVLDRCLKQSEGRLISAHTGDVYIGEIVDVCYTRLALNIARQIELYLWSWIECGEEPQSLLLFDDLREFDFAGLERGIRREWLALSDKHDVRVPNPDAETDANQGTTSPVDREPGTAGLSPNNPDLDLGLVLNNGGRKIRRKGRDFEGQTIELTVELWELLVALHSAGQLGLTTEAVAARIVGSAVARRKLKQRLKEALVPLDITIPPRQWRLVSMSQNVTKNVTKRDL